MRITWATVGEFTPHSRVLAALGDEQVRRFRALAPREAARFLAGRQLMHALIESLAPGADMTVRSVCSNCGGPHGAPSALAAGVLLSVSYATDRVVVAAAHLDVATAVGVDVESRHRDDRAMTDLAPLFAPREPPTRREWTRIEAVLKADGRGLRVPPNAVRFRETADPRIMLAGVPGAPRPFRVQNAPSPPAHIVSLAIA